MTSESRIGVVIPARNEAETIASVVRDVAWQVNAEIIVVDNGSADGTAPLATDAGARVVAEPTPGYGRACIVGTAAANDTDVLVFMDGDGSDVPSDIPALVAAVEAGADLALGVRTGARVERGSITFAARFGNSLCGRLLQLLYGRRLHDLSPLKAVRRSHLDALVMREQTYGWTVELLAKSLRSRASIVEIPVGYRRRAGGKSKVSGNLGAATRAGVRILATIGRVALEGRRAAMVGILAGAAVALAALALLGARLVAAEATSLRVLIAVWLAAWPTLLVCIGVGYAVAKLATARSLEPR
jgi:glycosyltransferase involved in cell wall biosynthesis